MDWTVVPSPYTLDTLAVVGVVARLTHITAGDEKAFQHTLIHSAWQGSLTSTAAQWVFLFCAMRWKITIFLRLELNWALEVNRIRKGIDFHFHIIGVIQEHRGPLCVNGFIFFIPSCQ